MAKIGLKRKPGDQRTGMKKWARALSFGLWAIASLAFLALWMYLLFIPRDMPGLEDSNGIAGDYQWVDFVTQAEELRAQGELTSARDLLEQALRIDEFKNRPRAESLLREIDTEIEDRNSPLASALRGAITGEADNLASLAGAGVTDLFVVGDIRDLVVQTASDDPDNFIRLLATVGIGTSFVSASGVGVLAEGGVLVTKALRKMGALSKKFVSMMSKLIKSGQASGAWKKCSDAFSGIFHLHRGTKSFERTANVMRHVDDIDSLKKAGVVAGLDPGAPRTLNSALVLARRGRDKATQLGRDTIAYLADKGHEGLEKIRGALKYGRKGISDLVRRGRLVQITRTVKFSYKAAGALVAIAERVWSKNKELAYRVIRMVLLGLLPILFLISLGGSIRKWRAWRGSSRATRTTDKHLQSESTVVDDRPAEPESSPRTLSRPRPLGLVAGSHRRIYLVVAAVVVLGSLGLGMLGGTTESTRPEQATFGQEVVGDSTMEVSTSSLVVIAVIFLLQLGAALGALWHRETDSIRTRFFAEAPLYLGLLGSVVGAMVLVAAGPAFMSGLWVAYTTTAVGLLIYLICTYFLVIPAEQRNVANLQQQPLPIQRETGGRTIGDASPEAPTSGEADSPDSESDKGGQE